jgi:hypothetical protein
MVDSFVLNQTGPAPAIRVGDVLSRSFSLFAARWAPFVGLSLIAYAPNLILGLLLTGSAGISGGAGPVGVFVTTIIQFVCSALANAAIIYGVVQELRGRGFTFSESLSVGFGRTGAVVGLSLLVGVLVGVASLLLLIPGIIVWCIYSVAIPVCVAERLGPRASMTRSSFLTKGNRWRIFGIILVIVLASMVFGAIFGGLAAMIGGFLLVQIVSFVIEALFGAFNAVAIGVLYYQLRVVREGADIEKIAAVFD